jgi:branched-chain amino acid transport system ATP-binding protein
MLKIENLVATYGKIKALKGVTLQVDDGEIIAVIGANGAGKSTLLKSVLGLVKLEGGRITFNGLELTRLKYYTIVSSGISIVPEGRGIIPNLTVEGNLEIGTFSRKKDKALDARLYEQVYEYFPRLRERRKQMGGTLSGGEQQMLAIGRALMSQPKLLALDEPSMGLAPMMVNQVFEIIKKIKQTGTTMMLVEQNARKALKVSDRVYVLNTGLVVATDESKNMLKNPELLKAYLGTDDDEARRTGAEKRNVR